MFEIDLHFTEWFFKQNLPYFCLVEPSLLENPAIIQISQLVTRFSLIFYGLQNFSKGSSRFFLFLFFLFFMQLPLQIFCMNEAWKLQDLLQWLLCCLGGCFGSSPYYQSHQLLIFSDFCPIFYSTCFNSLLPSCYEGVIYSF